MKFKIPFDGIKALDIGNNAPECEYSRDEISDRLMEAWPTDVFEKEKYMHTIFTEFGSILQQRALEGFCALNAQAFPEEAGEDVIEFVRELCDGKFVPPVVEERIEFKKGGLGADLQIPESEMYPADELPDEGPKAWRTGNALRLDLVYRDNVDFKVAKENFEAPIDLCNFAVREIMKTLYRRWNLLETPLAARFVAVFKGSIQPTTMTIEMTYMYHALKRMPTFEECKLMMRRTPDTWKMIVQEQLAFEKRNSAADPKQAILENAAEYNNIKQFFGDEELK